MRVKPDFKDELQLHIQAGYPFIFIQTVEEQRAIIDITTVVNTLSPQRDLYVWDYVKGYHNKDHAIKDPVAALEFIESSDWKQPGVFILKDFHKVINVGGIIRYLRNLVPFLKEYRKTVIFTSTEICVPADIEDSAVIIEYGYPCYKEIEKFVINFSKRNNMQVCDLEQIVHACQGFTLSRLGLVLKKILLKAGNLSNDAIRLISDEKRQLIKSMGVLEYIDSSEGFDDIGGLDNFKKWIDLRHNAFLTKHESYKLPAPKGILLTGIQGTGKSLCAKVVAKHWNVPLLRLDIGRLMGSYVGESEERARNTLKLADAIAPCILWIDEVDKAFGGIGELQGDSGTARRVFGTIITWMQERSSEVFIVATANNIDVLPPEFMRKGRFDEIFFVDLPDSNERKKIFSIHLLKKGCDAIRLSKERSEVTARDLEKLASLTEGFSGAEIESLIIDALFIAFDKSQPLTIEHIFEATQKVIPLSVTMRNDIEKIRSMVLNGRLRRA